MLIGVICGKYQAQCLQQEAVGCGQVGSVLIIDIVETLAVVIEIVWIFKNFLKG